MLWTHRVFFLLFVHTAYAYFVVIFLFCRPKLYAPNYTVQLFENETEIQWINNANIRFSGNVCHTLNATITTIDRMEPKRRTRTQNSTYKFVIKWFPVTHTPNVLFTFEHYAPSFDSHFIPICTFYWFEFIYFVYDWIQQFDVWNITSYVQTK